MVETGRGGMGARTYWCVATSHALNTCEVVDSVDRRCGRSATAEFELGKLMSKTPFSERHGPCMHRSCVYKLNTFVCRRWDTPPYIINKVLIW